MLTVKLKLYATPDQDVVLAATMAEYISLVNDVVDYALGQGQMPKLSTSSVFAKLPTALSNQCLRDARSVYRRCCKTGIHHILRKPEAIWNNQNYRVFADHLEFPVLLDGRCKRIAVKTVIPQETYDLLNSRKLGTLRITRKNGKLIAQIAYEEIPVDIPPGNNVMGVDLGLKCPAVSVTADGKTRFYGNGRQNKTVRRRHNARRKKLGKAKKLKAIRKLHNKEQRWMKDQDHKISRAIVNEAVRCCVGIIKLESLSGIRSTARTSRKNNHSLHSWSFYRLAHYIEYKAKLAGIQVVYVDPAYTSQACPVCGNRHKAKDRLYVCPQCGFTGHRDRVGAVNILAA